MGRLCLKTADNRDKSKIRTVKLLLYALSAYVVLE